MEHIRKQNIFDLDHKDPGKFVKLEIAYFRVAASASLDQLINEERVENCKIHEFRLSILNFYIDVVTDIKKRFKFDDSLFEIIRFIEPKEARKFKQIVESSNQKIPNFRAIRRFTGTR